jgi:hypothetical protein
MGREMILLGGSLRLLQDQFDGESGRLRFLALLSPT